MAVVWAANLLCCSAGPPGITQYWYLWYLVQLRSVDQSFSNGQVSIYTQFQQYRPLLQTGGPGRRTAPERDEGGREGGERSRGGSVRGGGGGGEDGEPEGRGRGLCTCTLCLCLCVSLAPRTLRCSAHAPSCPSGYPGTSGAFPATGRCLCIPREQLYIPESYGCLAVQ